MESNYYQLLEVPENASQEEIKKSYRRLSMMYHPDKNKGNTEATHRFQQISDAYETLGDVEKRKEYDWNLRGIQGEDILDDLFSKLFPGAKFFSSMPVHIQSRSFSHGNGNLQKPLFYSRPPPIVQTLAIPMDKILTEIVLPVEIERWILTENGKITENETIYVKIPKGVDEGELIVLHGRGHIVDDLNKGDVKLFVHIENNTEFKRNGLDLIYEKAITVKEALCGFSFELKYLTGKVFTIHNQSENRNVICDNYQKVIPQMGLSRDEISQAGNLIIVFRVKFPDKLSEEVTNQLKEIDF